MHTSDMLANYVYWLGELPQNLPITLDAENEQHVFQGLRFCYQSLSLWLRHFLLGEALAEEAFLTDMQYYQPAAELLVAEFRLATGVHPRSANPLIRRFDSPACLWFCCHVDMSQRLLADTGITNLPKLEGKQAAVGRLIKAVNLLENLHLPYQGETKSLRTKLVVEAQEIAKTDANFQLDYFSPYLRVLKRSINKDKNCESLQNIYLQPDGQLYQTQKNKKLPPRQRNVKKNN